MTSEMTFRAGRRGAPRRRVRLPRLVHRRPRSPPRTSPARRSSARCGSGTASTRGAARRAPGSARSRARSRSTTSAPSAGARGARSSPPCRSVRGAASPRASRPSSRPRSRGLTAGEREVIALRVVLDLDAGTAAQRARHLAHQLHDAPEPRAQEARGGTPCRSVTWSPSCAARASSPRRAARARPPDRRGRARPARAASPGAARSSSRSRSRPPSPRASSSRRPGEHQADARSDHDRRPATATCAAPAAAARPIGARDGARTQPVAPRSSPAERADPRPALRRVRSSLRLRADARVSDGVKRALRIAASLGGYPASVHVDAERQGRATPTSSLKVPRAHVQEAIARLSALGTITARTCRHPGPAGRRSNATDRDDRAPAGAARRAARAGAEPTTHARRSPRS